MAWNNSDLFRRRESKYGAKKVDYKGEKFDSVKEFSRYNELKMLQQAGEISGLKRQVKYVLIPKQNDPDTGRLLEREASYIADSVYKDKKTGETVVEDVKGYTHSSAYNLFVLKRKLMLQVYGIIVHEV